MNDDASTAEPSSRRQNLEDELRRVQETVATLDTHIDGLKQELGWTLETPSESTVGEEAHLELWKTLSTRSPVAEAIREFHGSRGRGGQKTRGVPRARGRPTEVSAVIPSRTTGSKRTRVLSSKEKRVEGIWTQCGSILSALKKHRYAWPFLQSVDAEALNIPDYYEVITRPMDLATITRRLDHDPRRGRYRQYTSPLEFRDDVRLVWSNCRTYNKPGQDVRIMGDALSETWEKKWCQAEIETKWANRHDAQADADEEETAWPNPSSRKKGGRGSMSFLEKRKLARQITALNTEQVAIISELLQSLNVSEEEGEMVLDLEKMDSQKLWIIKNKVDAITTKIKRTPIQP